MYSRAWFLWSADTCSAAALARLSFGNGHNLHGQGNFSPSDTSYKTLSFIAKLEIASCERPGTAPAGSQPLCVSCKSGLSQIQDRPHSARQGL